METGTRPCCWKLHCFEGPLSLPLPLSPSLSLSLLLPLSPSSSLSLFLKNLKNKNYQKKSQGVDSQSVAAKNFACR